jgi:hypothetical protein
VDIGGYGQFKGYKGWKVGIFPTKGYYVTLFSAREKEKNYIWLILCVLSSFKLPLSSNFSRLCTKFVDFG